jgi:hypothetical protein
MEARMKISELIKILKEYKKKYGDVEVSGECAICQNMEMELSVMTCDKDKTVAVQVGETY